jgi:DNA-binding NarL/FixJ family response regulator
MPIMLGIAMSNTIVLAEPHPLARGALTMLLEEDPRLTIVPANDLAGALHAVERSGADVLVVSRRLLERSPRGMRLPEQLPTGTRTIVLGLEDHPAFAAEARRAGADAYVLKDRADVDLPAAVDALSALPGLSGPARRPDAA